MLKPYNTPKTRGLLHEATQYKAEIAHNTTLRLHNTPPKLPRPTSFLPWQPEAAQCNPVAAHHNPEAAADNPGADHCNPEATQDTPKAAKCNPEAAQYNPRPAKCKSGCPLPP